jgi:ADP-dependent NAD(P)H-hydrate dehydratase / NAD(P)H-hydrate epimerase
MNNELALWAKNFPKPIDTDYKYSRGQVFILGGIEMTGAACLAAHAAARIGAGLVTIISPTFDFQIKENSQSPISIYRNFMPNIIVREGMSFLDYIRQAERKGLCVPVIGPGLGNDTATIRKIVVTALKRNKPIILDADALNAFGGQPDQLFEALHSDVILTPHRGEFNRLFPNLIEMDSQTAVSQACATLKGVLVLKGAKTIIAQKEKTMIINDISSPYLATAGTGDVLAGIIAGLVAQGMPCFESACAGVWVHGRAAQTFGAGLIASDLPDLIPQVLQEVLGFQEKLV